MADESKSVSFKDTLNLPHTDFPIRPNAAIDDPAMISRWASERLYEKAFYAHEGNKKYVLHMGPPYANGHIHLGHAYTTILKDIMTKGYRMAGFHAPVTPGWDCHGLPTEIKVVQEQPDLSRVELKKACRAYAQKWVDVQRSEFKRLGIVMDWDRPYITMDPGYEASTIRAFGQLIKGGFIERKNKTVAWCFHDKTVLAAAEIEYKERKDPSVYVRFELAPKDAARLFPEAKGEAVHFLIWTTTPWTLPLNRAVLMHPEAGYVLVRLGGKLTIVGARTLPKLAALIKQTESESLKTFHGSYLANAWVQHPFAKLLVPVIFDTSVGLDDGTACVHIAPGCGPDDYELGVKNGLEIYSPIAPDGTYTEGIEPVELKGTSVTDGQGWVIKKLMEAGTLLHKESITHSYPHCWRCRNGLIFRATKQWFFNLEHEEVRQRAVDAASTAITFMPPEGREFLVATLKSRWEWCLSRQRVWGVPITALLCNDCDHVYVSQELADRVAQSVATEGIEYWDRVTAEELVKELSLSCSGCKGKYFKKEMDILDVWFDSGVSHYAVLLNNPALTFPADLYLEGIDQHRGWFQSSLLTAMVLEKRPPMKAIMTHGFTVDEKGQKMSKSLGNVVAPEDVIKELGTDGLRLWVASVGHDGDAVMSKALLQNVGEVYRKIRNTARFLVANLYDFDKNKDSIGFENLLAIDRAILGYLTNLNNEVVEEYHSGNFTAVYHALGDFCTVTLSSWYLDIIKDRLYVEKSDGHLRRSAQTACWHILDTLTRLMAPILSFTSEQLSDVYQKDKKDSIHLELFANPSLEDMKRLSFSLNEWELLKELRSAVLKALEIEREKGVIKHSLEARVELYIDPAMKGFQTFTEFGQKLTGQTLLGFFKEFFIVSQVFFHAREEDLMATTVQGFYATVSHAQGVKCPRCWNWDDVNLPHNLCRRCSALLKS